METYWILKDDKKEPQIILKGHDIVVRQMVRKFNPPPNGLDLIAYFETETKLIRTNQQLKYLFAHLANVALEYLQNEGWSTIRTKEQAINFLKEPMGFCQTQINEVTGEIISTPRSLSMNSAEERAEVGMFIQNIFMELLMKGYEVIHPDDYLKGKRIRKTR
jgi:hypothetical protein